MRVEKIVCGFTALVSFPFNCFLGGGDLPPRYMRVEKIVCGFTALVFFPLAYFLGGGDLPLIFDVQRFSHLLSLLSF